MDPMVSELQIALNLGRPAGGGECFWHQVPDVAQVAEGADALLLLTER